MWRDGPAAQLRRIHRISGERPQLLAIGIVAHDGDEGAAHEERESRINRGAAGSRREVCRGGGGSPPPPRGAPRGPPPSPENIPRPPRRPNPPPPKTRTTPADPTGGPRH